mgnify:FL=1
MLVRVHTRRSLRLAGVGGLVIAASLSLALLVSPVHAGLITTAVAIAGALFAVAAGKAFRTGTADLSLISRDERRNFLVTNTAWMLAMILAFGVVITLIFTSLPFPLRAGLGHAALLAGAVFAWMFARTSAAHGRKILPKL